MKPAVCIVAPHYLSATPRVVKEADALHAAGYDVRVVFSKGNLAMKSAHDDSLLQTKRWDSTAVSWAPRGASLLRYLHSGMRQKVCRRMPSWSWPFARVAERAEGRVFPELARTAAAVPADLYIGHYPAQLAAAALAARRWSAKLGYDAEDFHTGEPIADDQQGRIAYIERRYLRLSDHLTAASSGIAAALSKAYDTPEPVVIYNTFPWADRAQIDKARRDRRGPELSLYWFSQWVGLDRGLQDAVRAMSLLKGEAQLHVRGSLSADVRDQLMNLAGTCGVADRLHFHPQVPPDELLSRAAEHDVGLALEHPVCLNRRLATSNKLFLYMLAGLAVVASDLPGQRAILEREPAIGALYTPGDHEALARCLERWRANPDHLAAAKAAALRAARERWNWEAESRKLVGAVDRLLARVRPR